jgi:hypothetical protein
MMKDMGARHRLPSVHPRSLLLQLYDRIRGRDQLLIQAGDELPLVVASYPKGRSWFGASLQSALYSIFRSLSGDQRAAYRDALDRVPSLVVAELRRANACRCLGHHHPAGTESRLARRLAADTGLVVGEIDLAVHSIRDWQPQPLAALAAAVAATERSSRAETSAELEYRRFHTALLAVFLHEIEHLAFPDRPEHAVRRRSDEFYLSAMSDYVRVEYGVAYGIQP